MSSDPKAVYLKDYLPPQFLIPEVQLDFQLDEERCVVEADLHFARNPDSAETQEDLFLNGEHLNLLEIKRDGNPLDESQFQVSEKGLLLKNCPDQFRLQTKVELQPQDNKAFSGLYKTKTIFCTQMEAQGFRRTTYFLDRPDVLSKYTVNIEADAQKYPVLLSNGNFLGETDLENGRKKATWEDPFPKPCYLFALVGGDLDWIEDSYMTRSNRKVDLKIFVDKGKQDRARYAMDSLKQSMKWDEDSYRLEYDLDIYNIVAVDDFNMGAMENKGLNIFNSKYVLASAETATDNEYHGIQRVIGHEYFHNWTGNRVTCRDWFQLSLKEGLTVFRDQEFSCDLNSRAVKRIEDVAALRSRQFPEDAGPMAHPVRPPSYIAIDNFYTVTVYEKGAEVIRMLHSLLGDPLFKKGVTKYFDLYDGQAVTTDDWIHAMEQVSKRDLTQFKRWYDQAGTPQVSVKTHYNEAEKILNLEITQQTKNPITGEPQHPFHMPIRVGLLSQQGSPLEFIHGDNEEPAKEGVLELTQEQQNFQLKNVYEAPIVSVNREFSAPIHLNYEQTAEELYLLMEKDPDSFIRWESAQVLYRKSILNLYEAIKNGEAQEVPAELLNTIQNLVEKGLDEPALTACLLTPPDLPYLSQFLEDIDPIALKKAHDQFRIQISRHIQPKALQIYEDLHAKNLGQSSQDIALRSFKNKLLSYLYRGNEAQGAALFKKQFDEAQNMTDTLSALYRLSQNCALPEFKQATDEFLRKWSEDSLVMNKLFSVYSTSDGAGVFDQIKKVSQSPEFDDTNPNNIFSLFYTFGLHNWGHFHLPENKAYDWFAEQTLAVDQRNPQVSARLGSCLNQWKKWAEPYRGSMKKALEKMAAGDPSDNLYEIVSRALKA